MNVCENMVVELGIALHNDHIFSNFFPKRNLLQKEFFSQYCKKITFLMVSLSKIGKRQTWSLAKNTDVGMLMNKNLEDATHQSQSQIWYEYF